MIVVIKETEEYMSTFSIPSIGERTRNKLSEHSLSSSNSSYFWSKIVTKRNHYDFLSISLFFSLLFLYIWDNLFKCLSWKWRIN